MKLSLILLLVFLTAISAQPSLAQDKAKGIWTEKELTIEEMLDESQAELIFVGSIESFGRTYSREGIGDVTIATYKVSKVLKGKYANTYVSVTFSGHIGFGEGESINFVTSNAKLIGLDRDRCAEKACFYTDVSWSLSWTKSNEDEVQKVLKVKKTSDPIK